MRRMVVFWFPIVFLAAECRVQVLHVEHVADRDTFVLCDGRTVRLIGIDTPEEFMSDNLRQDARRSGRDIETIQALGRKASQYAKGIVEGKPVELEYDPANAAQDHKGTYGRTLAYVWVVDDQSNRLFNVNKRLVQGGYANAYKQYPFQYKERYLRVQREARENGRGLWGKGSILSEKQERPSERRTTGRRGEQDCGDFGRQASAQRFFP